MRLLASAAAWCAVAALTLPVAAGSSETAARTSLQIVVWPRGKSGPARRWTLRCGPVGGSLPDRRRACRSLAPLRAPFRRVPPATICTRIYGGPATALVRGLFRGKRVRATFKRTDGCQIARWDRVRFLFRLRS